MTQINKLQVRNGEIDRTDQENRAAAWTAMKYLYNKRPKKYTLKIEGDDFVLIEMKLSEDNVVSTLPIVETK